MSAQPAQPATGECILWTRSQTDDGYGASYRNGRNLRAHQIAWLDAGGELLPGMVLHHVCREKLCINASHLVQLSRAEHNDLHKQDREPNQARGERAGACKLTDDQVTEIRTRYRRGSQPDWDMGTSASELAHEFGVSRTYIHALARGAYRA